MTSKRVILVTGVSSYWGTQVASRLLEGLNQTSGENLNQDKEADNGDYRVIGIDIERPQVDIRGLDFIPADVRNPLIIDLLRAEEVHTVCHLQFAPSYRRSEKAFDANVIGTMKLFGACADAGVQKIVLKSSTSVYGALPKNPAFLTEEHPVQGRRELGYNRDLLEIESFCNGFSRQEPEIQLTILRFAHIVGPTADTPMTRFLRQPLSPCVLGFDPMMQVIHEQDVVNAILHSIKNDVPGTYNISAEGAMPLSRVMGLAGKMPLPVLYTLASWGTDLFAGTRLPVEQYVPLEWSYLRFSCVADLKRMNEKFGFIPRYTASETLREFASFVKLNRYSSQASEIAQEEEHLQNIISIRSRMRDKRE